MAWLSLDLAGKVIVPLLTFGLGLAVAWAVRRREAQRAEDAVHVRSAARLANDWYSQLQDLDAEAGLATAESRRAAYLYVNSRIVLPQLLLDREYLSCSGRHARLVAALDDFLARITVREPAGGFTCRPMFGALGASLTPQGLGASDVIRGLDGDLQQINRLAGETLAR